MDRETFREQMLCVMDQKSHWAWPAFTSGRVPKDKLHYHFEQEYGAYVRDFPVMVGWAYVHCPIPAVRQSLAANLYEEETGGLVAGKPHPELFLEYPRGLGMDLTRFEKIQLLPAAQRYRNFLDEALRRFGWDVSAALATIFIEGTNDERAALNQSAPVAQLPLEEHPLVKFYGLPVENLALTKAHRLVEGGHRIAAWHAIVENVAPTRRGTVVRAMDEAQRHWSLYRDEVAALCGVTKVEDQDRLGAVA